MDKLLPVHVAIPHYNTPDTLPPLLTRLSKDEFTSITVLDDCSADRSALEDIQRTFANVEIVYGEQNRGAGGNRNRLLQLGKVGVVWFLDCDMEIITTHNAATIRQLFAGNIHQLIGGTILNKSGVPMAWNYGHEMHPQQDELFGALADKRDDAALQAHGWDYPWLKQDVVSAPREVDWVAEGSFVVACDDFAHVGGYDESFRYHEGQELAHRLRDIGVKVSIVPTIVTKHLEIDVRGVSRENEIQKSAQQFYEKFNIDAIDSEV